MGPLLLIPCSIFLFLNSTREFMTHTYPYLSYTRPSCSSPVYPLCVKSVSFPSPSCQLSSHWMPLLKRRFHQQQVGGAFVLTARAVDMTVFRISFITDIMQSQE